MKLRLSVLAFVLFIIIKSARKLCNDLLRQIFKEVKEENNYSEMSPVPDDQSKLLINKKSHEGIPTEIPPKN